MSIFGNYNKNKKYTGYTPNYNRNTTEEYAKEVAVTGNTNTVGSYSTNGVHATGINNNIKLTYDGLLAKSGAHKVYAAVGYGNNTNWEDVEYYPMDKISTQAFETHIPLKRMGSINIAFKDCASNWDNNSGMNYTFTT